MTIKNRIVTENICLHIGCGLVTGKDWINTDVSPSLRISQLPLVGKLLITAINGPLWHKSVRYLDIVEGSKGLQGTCDLIYASHVLEHLALSDFHQALDNIKNYLKDGGIFRALVPDLNKYIELYQQERNNQELQNKAAMNFIESIGIGCTVSRSNFYKRINEALANSRHQWMWDTLSLQEAFIQHGFEHVRQCEYGDYTDKRFAQIERQETFANAICIEGIAKK